MDTQLIKRTKIVLFFILTIALLGGAVYGGYRYWLASQTVPETPEPAAEESKPTPITEPTEDSNWNLYINKKYGFSVEYPVGWEVKESLPNTMGDDESRMESWVKFKKEDVAYINIFVRKSSKLDLLGWIRENGNSLALDEAAVPAETNAKVANLPAVIVYSRYTQAPAQVVTLFKKGVYVFGIAHFVTPDKPTLLWDKYEHFLRTFEFEESRDSSDELPGFPLGV